MNFNIKATYKTTSTVNLLYHDLIWWQFETHKYIYCSKSQYWKLMQGLFLVRIKGSFELEILASKRLKPSHFFLDIDFQF